MASVEVRDADPAAARAFLTGLERGSGIPPVDEDEQRRLAGHPPVRDPDWDWSAHLVLAGGDPVAYAGIRMPPVRATGCAARVDLAVDRDRDVDLARPALAAALDHLRSHARPHDGPPHATGTVEAWLRGVTVEDLTVAAQAGFHVQRRLHVLGVTADAHRTAAGVASAGPVPDGLTLRPFDPSDPADADAVVTLLTRAYPETVGGSADGSSVLQAADWFRPEDLLLLTSDAHGPADEGWLRALHWMKRRGGGVGEVYNLAVNPSVQGRGFGPLLLDAGLALLFATGIEEVVLWVDAENSRALDLYRSRQFTPRWDDVSLVG